MSLAAYIVGVLLMISDNSFWPSGQRMFYVLAELAAAYAHLGKTLEPRTLAPMRLFVTFRK